METKNSIKKLFHLTFNKALILLLLLLYFGIALMNPVIMKPSYLFGVLVRNVIEIGLIALPMTLIILTGGIDLSIGSMLVLSSMSGGMVAAATGNDFLGLLTCLTVGALCGFFNGFLITKFQLSPFIATLATMYLYMGIARGMSQGDSVYSYNLTKFFGNYFLGEIPLQSLFYIIIAIVFYILQTKTVLGRYLSGMGYNTNAVRYSGIDTNKTTIFIYLICGLISAFTSLIWLGRFTSIKYDAGNLLNMKVITIVILGGTSINGGLGKVSGSIIATLIIGVLNSGLALLNIPIDTQTIIQSIILIISLVGNTYFSRLVKKHSIIKPVLEE